MTAPRQEPSTKRDIVGLGWGERQLARRPVLFSCPCPLDWAFALGPYAGGAYQTTVSTGVPTALDFSQYAINPDSTAFQINDSNRPIKIVLGGFYQMWLQIEWAGGTYTDTRQAEITKSGSGAWINNDSTYVPRITNQDPYLAGQTVSFGPLWADADAGHVLNLGVSVEHSAAGDELVDQVRLTVVYLGPPAGISNDWDSDWGTNYLVDFFP